MTQRVQIATNVRPEIKRMLQQMAIDDLRTIRGELEHLIREEHQRRQAPHHKLVDAPVGYHDVDDHQTQTCDLAGGDGVKEEPA